MIASRSTLHASRLALIWCCANSSHRLPRSTLLRRGRHFASTMPPSHRRKRPVGFQPLIDGERLTQHVNRSSPTTTTEMRARASAPTATPRTTRLATNPAMAWTAIRAKTPTSNLQRSWCDMPSRANTRGRRSDATASRREVVPYRRFVAVIADMPSSPWQPRTVFQEGVCSRAKTASRNMGYGTAGAPRSREDVSPRKAPR